MSVSERDRESIASEQATSNTNGVQHVVIPTLAALLDVRAVAALLGGCSTRHVYRLADAGKMPPPVRLGSLVRWSRLSIDEWLANDCKPVRTVTSKGGGR